MTQQFLQAKKMVDRAQNILLAIHENPDSDAIGSLLAMKIGLDKIGKKTTAFSISEIPASTSFLPKQEQIIHQVNLADFDLIVGLDYGAYQRLGFGDGDLTSRKFLTIDHHLVGEHLGFKIINNKYSSTAEILYEFLPYLNIEVDHEIATCLLAGIYSDTGGFRHPNTSAQTLKIVGELLLKGAPLQKIVKFSDGCNLTENLDTWIEAFKNLKFDIKSGVIFSIVVPKNLASVEDFSGSSIASLLSNAPEIKLALLCVQKEPNIIECSLRSQKDRGVNVAKIAQLFGGGGHRLAAGFQTDKKPEEIITMIKSLQLESFSS